MYCAPNVISLDLVPVSKQHLFTPSLFVFTVKITHCRDKKKRRISLSWYSKLQVGKPRAVRVLSVQLDGIWINARQELEKNFTSHWGGRRTTTLLGCPGPLEGGAGQLGRGLSPAWAGTGAVVAEGTEGSLCPPHRSNEQQPWQWLK